MTSAMSDAELAAALGDVKRRIEQRAAGRPLWDLAGDKGLDALRAQRDKLQAEQRRRERGRLAADLRTQRAALLTKVAAACEVARGMEASAAQLDALDRAIGARPVAQAAAGKVRGTLESLLAGQP